MMPHHRICKGADSLEKQICLDSYPVRATLKVLLQDKTTKQNIIWATDTYSALGSFFEDDSQIYEEAITGVNRDLLQPRIAKALSEQADRTKKHAEVFTPAWICNQMNNYCDAEWFDRENVFNRQNGTKWVVNGHRIRFLDDIPLAYIVNYLRRTAFYPMVCKAAQTQKQAIEQGHIVYANLVSAGEYQADGDKSTYTYRYI